MKLKAVFILMMVLLATHGVVIGSVNQSLKKDVTQQSSSQILIEMAEDAVRKVLKDPYAAQFRNVHVGHEDFKPVRGEVNAKNSYGRYNGFEKFFVGMINGKEEVGLESDFKKILSRKTKSYDTELGMPPQSNRAFSAKLRDLTRGDESIQILFDDDAVKYGDGTILAAYKKSSKTYKKVMRLQRIMFVEGW
ncbi:MAG: hypothetical protein HGA59_00505 [Chlorobiaceae bacterium]|nr:hypothetical protein [Chlorobiaceae bacterium]